MMQVDKVYFHKDLKDIAVVYKQSMGTLMVVPIARVELMLQEGWILIALHPRCIRRDNL